MTLKKLLARIVQLTMPVYLVKQQKEEERKNNVALTLRWGEVYVNPDNDRKRARNNERIERLKLALKGRTDTDSPDYMAMKLEFNKRLRLRAKDLEDNK